MTTQAAQPSTPPVMPPVSATFHRDARSIPIQTYFCSLTDTQWPVWVHGHGGNFVSEGQSYRLKQPAILLKKPRVGTTNKAEFDIPKGTERLRFTVLKQPLAPKGVKTLFKVYLDEEKAVRTIFESDIGSQGAEITTNKLTVTEVHEKPGWKLYTYEMPVPSKNKKLGFQFALLPAEEPLTRKENKIMFNQLQVDMLGGDTGITRFHPNMRINEPFWVCTHNAFANFEDRWNFANQSVNITSQLRLGVRCFMLDVYQTDTGIVLRHVIQTSDERRLRDTLKEMKEFLNSNPNEILMIIFEDHLAKEPATEQKILQEFAESNTEDEIFRVHKPNTSVVDGVTHTWDVAKDGWPTVSTLVRMRRRIIVFTDNPFSGFPWQWQYMVENVFGNDSITPETWVNERSDSEKARNDYPDRSYLLMNHFGALNVVAGIAEDSAFFRAKSYKANDAEVITKQMKDYEKKFGYPPNIVAVDFVDIGYNGAIWAAMHPYIEAKWKEVSQRPGGR